MEFSRAFSFPFEDQEWLRKLVIAALISLIPIVGQIFLIGWMLDVTRRVIIRDATPLPEIDFGRQLIDGLKGMVVGLVYTIPVYIILAPIWIIALMSQNIDQNTFGWLISLVSICCTGLVVFYALLLAFITPAAFTNMVVKDSLGAAFHFSEIMALIKAAPGGYLLVLLGVIVSTGLIAPLGAIACGIGALFTATYAVAVNGHLYGQAYIEAMKNRGLGY
jgi:hypothetical protein